MNFGSLEAFIENILYKIPFLGITNDTAATNFAAHIGWSIAMPMLAHQWFGVWGVWTITVLYTVESICWKLFTWNYWTFFKEHRLPPDWWNDFVIDLVSRLAVPVGMSIYYIVEVFV